MMTKEMTSTDLMTQDRFDQILQRLQRRAPRQFEVLQYLLLGTPDADIAEALVLAPASVRKHIERICTAFNLSNEDRRSKRAELFALCVKFAPYLLEGHTAAASNGHLNQTVPSVVTKDPVSTDPVRTAEIAVPVSTTIRHNLPIQDFETLLGREQELAQLIDLLSFHSSAYRISIEGPGGIGKTSLILAAAYYYLEQSVEYDAIIFTSAQAQRLFGNQTLDRLRRERTQFDIFQAIVKTLGYGDVLGEDPVHQFETIREILGYQPTLLIIDNIERVDDLKAILALIIELPPTVKIVVTSRMQLWLDVTIALNSLPVEASLKLIQKQAQRRHLNLKATVCKQLHQLTGGIPVAIIFAASQVSQGHLPTDVFLDPTTTQDFARYCFDSAIQPLRGYPSHRLFMAMSLCSRPTEYDILSQVALTLEERSVLYESIDQLVNLSVIKREHSRVDMLPLTREYARLELDNHPEFFEALHRRWLDWAKGYLRTHGNLDWREWYDYSAIEDQWPHLAYAVEWCIVQDDHNSFRELWLYLKGAARLRGYWQESLVWLEWWTAASVDNPLVHTEALLNYSQLLGLLNQPIHRHKALELNYEAWNCIKDYSAMSLRAELVLNFIYLLVWNKSEKEAWDWLHQGEVLAAKGLETATETSRFIVCLCYYQALLASQANDYEQAKQLYLTALRSAQALGWRRLTSYIRGWLATVLMNLQEFDGAHQLLAEGLADATANQDYRSMAYCQMFQAKLAAKQGHNAEACQLANGARDTFEWLYMRHEAHEMSMLLSEMGAKDPRNNR